MTSLCKPSNFGADPVNIKWDVVRGDTAKLRVEFLEEDETTFIDTTGWLFESTVYNDKDGIFDELHVVPGNGFVDILAYPEVTEFWGKGIKSKVAELNFDLEVTIDDEVWTPVIGIVSVLGDVTGGRL
jgi:hypothetical protein